MPGEVRGLPLAMDSPSVADRLLLVAGQWPERVAVIDTTGAWTFGELARGFCDVAAAVAARRLPPGAPVALLCAQDRTAAAAMIGIAGAGHPVVVLDPGLPPERMRHVLQLAGAAALVTGSGMSAPAPLGGELALLDLAAPLNLTAPLDLTAPLSLTPLQPAAPSLPPRARRHDDPFLISFTSGSTGEPKGVISHQPVFLAEMDNAHHDPCCAQPGDVVLVSLPLSFGGGYGWLLNSLGVGATCVVADARDVGREGLHALAAAHRVTVLPATPSLLRSVVTEDDQGRRATAALRVLTSLGEAVSSDDLRTWRRVVPDDCVITNEVGSSKAGKIARLALFPGDPVPPGVVPVGAPVRGKHLDIVSPDDPHGPALPPGSTGLLRITSRAISPGYVRASAEDHARSTRPDPADPSLIRLLTADLARWDGDGTLRLLGRADDAVKVNGYLVEPAEVVATLRALPGILDAAVQAGSGPGGRRELRAWLVVDEAPAGGASEIRRRLLHVAPPWTVPARIAIVPALPRNERGKIEYAALAGREPQLPPAAPPATATERTVAAAWARHLGVAEPSVLDGFSALGGDSLTAVALTGELAERFRVELTGGDLLRRPTIRELSALIDSLRAPRRAALRVRRRPRGERSTLTVLRDPSGSATATVLCIAGAGGSAFGFVPLADLLGAGGQASLRVVAAQAKGLERRALPDWTVHAAASRHAADLAGLVDPQSAGRVEIVGHSSGGVLATEAARRLRACGYRVGRVWLLDTVLPGCSVLVREGAEDDSRPVLAERVRLHARVATAGVVRRAGPLQRAVFWEHGRRLVGRHRLRPYTHPATLLHVAANRPDPAAWARLYPGDFRSEQLAGDHNSLLSPAHAHQVADRVRASLSTPTQRSADE